MTNASQNTPQPKPPEQPKSPEVRSPGEAAPRRSAPAAPSSKPLAERLPENVAGMLSYLLGWISGLFFLLVDRRPFVRYHAAQSVVVFVTLNICFLVLGDFFLASFIPGLGGPLLILRRILELTWIVASVVLMLKAYSGERYRVAYAATFAERASRAKE
jgi:uncharacterized membrane protein